MNRKTLSTVAGLVIGPVILHAGHVPVTLDDAHVPHAENHDLAGVGRGAVEISANSMTTGPFNMSISNADAQLRRPWPV